MLRADIRAVTTNKLPWLGRLLCPHLRGEVCRRPLLELPHILVKVDEVEAAKALQCR